jgi:hypothetical protein
MILGFAGWQNSIVQPGMHHLIGTAATVEEVREGLKGWMQAERDGWRDKLAVTHAIEYANTMACRLEFWSQIVEHRPGQEPEYVIVEETEARCHRCFTLPVGAVK